MKTVRLLSKMGAASWIDSLREERDLFGPVRGERGRVEWAPLEMRAKKLLWDFANTTMSPKDFFFPQSECMLRYTTAPSAKDRHLMKPVAPLARKRALINIRPCDARAFAVLDTIFIQDEQATDTYWVDKRENTLLVGLACNHPCSECFCTSVNSGPHAKEGMDILFVDMGDQFLVHPVTEQGEALVADLPPATPAHETRAKDLARQAEERMTESVDTRTVAESDLMELFNHSVWDSVHETCLNCGACTYCCPTCHCFDVQDEEEGDGPYTTHKGRRVRNWDSCMSPLFTRHASGHNPRGTSKDRVRQRFMHKFKYIPDKRESEIGCVGCGRCVRLCPVNIDVREVVRNMKLNPQESSND